MQHFGTALVGGLFDFTAIRTKPGVDLYAYMEDASRTDNTDTTGASPWEPLSEFAGAVKARGESTVGTVSALHWLRLALFG